LYNGFYSSDIEKNSELNMKNKLLLVFIMALTVLLGGFSQTRQAEAVTRSAPFSRGVNFSSWFEAESAQSINFTKYTEKDFADVKRFGADVIRLPISMHSMTSGRSKYILDPLFLKFLDTAVDWAEKYGLYIIIDNHSFHPVNHTPNNIDKILLPVWAQIAQRYKDRSDYVIYEILNEPHGITDKRWGKIQEKAIETIRRYDQKHAIIVGGTDFNSIEKLSAIPRYSDQNLIYTFHFYDPFLFTHQGSTWGEPLLGLLAGVPFPYDRSRMPETPNAMRGTWIESALRDYERSASDAVLNASLDRVVAFSRERNVPVFCGEFGVFIPNSLPEDRVRWYEFVTNALSRRNIARASWDYYGGFGIFNTDRGGDINYDVNVGVVRAMGFTPPAQSVRRQEILSAGFGIFDDYPNSQYVTVESWGDGMEFSMYDTNTAEGEFAIRWGNAALYNSFRFVLNRTGDFSRLAAEGYFLEFKARTERAVNFDVRLLNSESSSSIPWRVRYTIDERALPADGKWHTIRIPLAGMEEQGAWLNSTQQWLNPRREFTWQDITTLEFVAEQSAMRGRRVWIDSIRITK
jgi:endoglucanase